MAENTDIIKQENVLTVKDLLDSFLNEIMDGKLPKRIKNHILGIFKANKKSIQEYKRLFTPVTTVKQVERYTREIIALILNNPESNFITRVSLTKYANVIVKSSKDKFLSLCV